MLTYINFDSGNGLNLDSILNRTTFYSSSSSSRNMISYTENYGKTNYYVSCQNGILEASSSQYGNTVNSYWNEVLIGGGHAWHLGSYTANSYQYGYTNTSAIIISSGIGQPQSNVKIGYVVTGYSTGYSLIITNSKTDAYWGPGAPGPCPDAITIQDTTYTATNTAFSSQTGFVSLYDAYPTVSYVNTSVVTGGYYGTGITNKTFSFKSGYTYLVGTNTSTGFSNALTTITNVPTSSQSATSNRFYTYSKFVTSTKTIDLSALYGSPPYKTVLGIFAETGIHLASGVSPTTYYSALKDENLYILTVQDKYKRLAEIGTKEAVNSSNYSFWPTVSSTGSVQLYDTRTTTNEVQNLLTQNVFSNTAFDYHTLLTSGKTYTTYFNDTDFFNVKERYTLTTGSISYVAYALSGKTVNPPFSGFWTISPNLNVIKNDTNELFTFNTTRTYSYTSTKTVPVLTGILEKQILVYNTTPFATYLATPTGMFSYISTTASTTYISTGENWHKTTSNPGITFTDWTATAISPNTDNEYLSFSTDTCESYIYAYGTITIGFPVFTTAEVPTATTTTNYTMNYLASYAGNDPQNHEYGASQTVYSTKLNTGYTKQITTNNSTNLTNIKGLKDRGFAPLVNLGSGNKLFEYYTTYWAGFPSGFTGLSNIFFSRALPYSFFGGGYMSTKGVESANFPDILAFPFNSEMSSEKFSNSLSANPLSHHATIYPIYQTTAQPNTLIPPGTGLSWSTGIYTLTDYSTGSPWTYEKQSTYRQGLFPTGYLTNPNNYISGMEMDIFYRTTTTGMISTSTTGGLTTQFTANHNTTYQCSGTFLLRNEVLNENRGVTTAYDAITTRDFITGEFTNSKASKFDSFFKVLDRYYYERPSRVYQTVSNTFLGNEEGFKIMGHTGQTSYYTFKEPFSALQATASGLVGYNDIYYNSSTTSNTTNWGTDRHPGTVKDKWYTSTS